MLWGVSWVVGRLWGGFEVIELKYRHPRPSMLSPDTFPRGYSYDVLEILLPTWEEIYQWAARLERFAQRVITVGPR
jgi:hypothetical protein